MRLEVVEEREGDQNNRGEILNPFYSFAFRMGVIRGTKQGQTERRSGSLSSGSVLLIGVGSFVPTFGWIAAVTRTGMTIWANGRCIRARGRNRSVRNPIDPIPRPVSVRARSSPNACRWTLIH